MEPQRKYRFGTLNYNYWRGGGLTQFYGAPTFTLIFRRGITLDNLNKLYMNFN